MDNIEFEKYYVNVNDKKLIRVKDEKDFSDHIKDFSIFNLCGINLDGGIVYLTKWNEENGPITFIEMPRIDTLDERHVSLVSSSYFKN